MICEVPVYLVNLIGSPINYAYRMIGSPITSQSTALRHCEWHLSETATPSAEQWPAVAEGVGTFRLWIRGVVNDLLFQQDLGIYIRGDVTRSRKRRSLRSRTASFNRH